ncbi:MAG: hypothetical protein RL742_765, partial [Bacteroidota bacterium]
QVDFKIRLFRCGKNRKRHPGVQTREAAGAGKKEACE